MCPVNQVVAAGTRVERVVPVINSEKRAADEVIGLFVQRRSRARREEVFGRRIPGIGAGSGVGQQDSALPADRQPWQWTEAQRAREARVLQIEIRAVVHDRIGSQAEEILLGEVPLRRGEVGKDVFVRHTGEAELQLIFLVGFERGLTGDTQIQVPADLGPAVFDTQCKTGTGREAAELLMESLIACRESLHDLLFGHEEQTVLQPRPARWFEIRRLVFSQPAPLLRAALWFLWRRERSGAHKVDDETKRRQSN